MKKLLTLLITLLITFDYAIASTWIQIDDTEYIDKDSIRTYINDFGGIEYNKRVFWTKSSKKEGSYKDIEKDTKKKVSYSLVQSIIDYSNETIAIKSIALYAIDGSSLISNTYKDFELNWHSIIPNSNGELLARLVSKPRALKRMYKYQINNLHLQQNKN